MHSKGCIGNTAWSLELHCCMDLVSSWARRKVSTPSPRLRALPSPNSHLPLQGRRKGGDVSTFNLPSKPFLLRLFCPSLCVSLFVFPHHFLARHLFFPIIFSLAICRTHAHETELHNDGKPSVRAKCGFFQLYSPVSVARPSTVLVLESESDFPASFAKLMAAPVSSPILPDCLESGRMGWPNFLCI